MQRPTAPGCSRGRLRGTGRRIPHVRPSTRSDRSGKRGGRISLSCEAQVEPVKGSPWPGQSTRGRKYVSYLNEARAARGVLDEPWGSGRSRYGAFGRVRPHGFRPAGDARGRTIVNVVPRPTSVATSTRPPCAVTMFFTRDSPSPV